MAVNVCAATGSNLAAQQTKGRQRSATPPTAGTQSAAETRGRTNEGVRWGEEEEESERGKRSVNSHSGCDETE